jgi:putative ABC transport system permease protein
MTGRALFVGRLAAADIQRHPIEAVLLLLAIAGATSTLTLGLALHGVMNNPYQRTRSATAGPDVVAGLLTLRLPPANHRLGPGPGHETIFTNDERPSKKRTADFDALVNAAGVVAHSGPYPVAWTTLRVAGKSAGVAVEGRDHSQVKVDQPKLIQGSWVSPGEVVVEQSYAEALGIHVGDAITLNGRPFRVAGLAVTAAVPEYPDAEAAFGGNPFPHPGLIWATRADARSLATQTLPLSFLLNLKLHKPESAAAFVNAHANLPLSLLPWQGIAKRDAALITVEQRALTFGSSLLALLAVASVAVLVGGRMAEQTRRVGLLKAVGATPALVALVLLLEDFVLALLAAGAGILTGWLVAPTLIGSRAGLLGSAGAPALTASTVELVVGLALAVAIVATFIPAVRASRLSTVRALADAARSPRRRQKLIALSARLPIPLLLGIRLAARRPRRAILSAVSIAITVTTVVAVVTVHAQQALDNVAGFSAIDNPRNDRINHALLVVSVVLVILAAINALFVTWSTAVDSRHQLAIARALGGTPRQIGAGLLAAQLITALPGTIVGIPLGMALVQALEHGDAVKLPSAWALSAVFLVTLVAVAVLSSIPARIGARQPVADILRAELA